MNKLMEMTLEELWDLFPVIIKPYSPDYKDWYEIEKKNLLLLAGKASVFRINHIGSTSVEGLDAKPTVDILMEIKSGGDFENLTGLLEAKGWLLMSRDMDSCKKYVFNKGYTPKGFAERVYHLHLREAGDWDELYFRDYLKRHKETLEAYGSLKHRLQELYEHDRDGYTKAKTDFVMFYTKQARLETPGKYKPEE